jgi:hypothetical protein
LNLIIVKEIFRVPQINDVFLQQIDLPFDVLFVVLRTPLMARAYLVSFFSVLINIFQTHIVLGSAL